MPYTELFSGKTHTIGGVLNFKIATKTSDGDPITFPLDAIYQSGSTDTVLLSENYSARTTTIGNQTYEFRDVYPKTMSYNEEEVEDRQGRFWRKTLVFEMPKVNPTTQNQLKDFLFNSGGEFATSNVLLYFTDSNNQNWIASLDLPFILENYDTTNGARGGENKYVLRYVCNSYIRTLRYVNQ